MSVIIPVNNAEQYIVEAIESVQAQTTYHPLEIIAVDDGSTDSSAAVVQQFPNVRYYFQPNAGISATRNLGIKHCSGRLELSFSDFNIYKQVF